MDRVKLADRTIAVQGARGGGGASTLAAALAMRAASRGLQAGLLDADLQAPSAVTLVGGADRPRGTGERILPSSAQGVRLMSMELFVDDHQAPVWRGPLLRGIVHQFCEDVLWGDLDLLVVDMPTGCGEAQREIASKIQIDECLLAASTRALCRKGASRIQAFNGAHGLPAPRLALDERFGAGDKAIDLPPWRPRPWVDLSERSPSPALAALSNEVFATAVDQMLDDLIDLPPN
jgi:hypothetical protein